MGIDMLRVIIASAAIIIGATAFAQEQQREDETRAINELYGETTEAPWNISFPEGVVVSIAC
jgi:hypothetical protein